jgi:hypothetical protein
LVEYNPFTGDIDILEQKGFDFTGSEPIGRPGDLHHAKRIRRDQLQPDHTPLLRLESWGCNVKQYLFLIAQPASERHALVHGKYSACRRLSDGKLMRLDRPGQARARYA